MADISAEKLAKLPAWARDHIQTLNAEIRRLEGANLHLRGKNETGDTSPGYILLNGYGDEPIPLGKYFRILCTSGPSEGVEIAMDGADLSARVEDGWVSVIPKVSNVITLRRLDRA